MHEGTFDNKFKTYNSIDEYYQSSEMGIGEIHKIHGTIRMPRGIVLTKKDYELFESRSAVISSKIITLMCESPLLIIGYSMNDRIIRDIIGRIFGSFSREMADTVSNNILYVNYVKGSKPMRGTMQVECSTGMFHIQVLTVDSFLPIFEDIGRNPMSFTIPQIRMLRKMLVEAVPFSNGESARLAFVGIEGIDEVDPERTVVALTTKTAVGTMKSFWKYDIDDLVKDVLNGANLPSGPIIDIWFEGGGQPDRTFLPIFDYLISIGRDSNSYSDKLKSFIETKHDQYCRFFADSEKRFSGVIDKASMQSIMDDVSLRFKRADVVAYAYHKGIIDRSEATAILKKQYDSAIATVGKTDTYIKRAVTYLGYKQFTE